MGQGNASIKNFLFPSATSRALPEGSLRSDPDTITDTVPPMPGGSGGEGAACSGSEQLPGGNVPGVDVPGGDVPGGRESGGDAAAESAHGTGGTRRTQTGGGSDQETLVQCMKKAADRGVREGHVSPCEGLNVRDPIKEGRANPGSSGDIVDHVGNVVIAHEANGCQLAMPSLQGSAEVEGPPSTWAPPSATSSHPLGIRSPPPLPPQQKPMVRKKGRERDSLKTLWDQVGTSVEVSTHRQPQVEVQSDYVYAEDSVDVNVLEELPLEIRKEVEAALLHAKEQKRAKVGASKGISRFFT